MRSKELLAFQMAFASSHKKKQQPMPATEKNIITAACDRLELYAGSLEKTKIMKFKLTMVYM